MGSCLLLAQVCALRRSKLRLTDRPDMTLDIYRGRKTTTQQQQQLKQYVCFDLGNTSFEIVNG